MAGGSSLRLRRVPWRNVGLRGGGDCYHFRLDLVGWIVLLYTPED